MNRAEAEAIYDSGREACVEFLVELTARRERRIARLEARTERLEERLRQNSRNSSRPPSSDPPKTRQQRRADARAKAKELFRAESERRKVGGQPGHRGSGRRLKPEDQVDEIVDHYPESCRGCGHRFGETSVSPRGASVATRSPSCRRPPWWCRSTAPTACAACAAGPKPRPSSPASSPTRRSGRGCERRW
jgi:Family of unknown function (DUF6444)